MERFELHAGDRFVTNTDEIRDPLYRRGCWLASNTLFRIERIDEIYTTREIPCTGGFDISLYEPEDYDVKYEVVRREDNTEFIVLSGRLDDLMDYFDDAFYTGEDDDGGYNWDDYSPVDSPVKYPKIIYYNFDPEQPYDPNNVPRIIHQDVSYWCAPSDDGEVSIEEYESDINIPGAISYFNGIKVEPPVIRRGFFSEGISRDFSGNDNRQNIVDVMNDEDLSGNDKAEILFGRTEDYMSHVQWLCYHCYERDVQYLFDHGYFTSEIKDLWENDRRVALSKVCEIADKAETINNPSGKRTLFLVTGSGPCTLDESWRHYVLDGEINGSDTLDKAQRWWIHMKFSVSCFEDNNITQATPKFRRGFFNENLTIQKFNSIDNDLIKRVILKYVHDHGYIGGSYGYHNNNGTSYRNSPTVAEITHILDSEDDLENWAVPQVLLGRMNNWVSNLHPEGQYADYQNKCIEIWNKTHMTKDDITMVASFCNSYLRDLEYQERQRQRQEREQQHQAAVASETNTWAGEVGDNVSFVVESAKIAYWITPRYYNAESYPCWTIKGTDGRTYIWNDTSDEVQVVNGMKFTGKIRRLTEFRGIKQTQVWRVEIKEPTGKVLGFFKESLENHLLERAKPSNTEIESIMESNLTEDEKCRKLFGVNQLIALQRLNKQNFDEEVSPLEEFYYDDWKHDSVCQWSLFIHGNYDGETEMNLTQSFKHYCKRESNPDGLYAGFNHPAVEWWKALEATIEYWAEQGDSIRPRVRGFFSN